MLQLRRFIQKQSLFQSTREFIHSLDTIEQENNSGISNWSSFCSETNEHPKNSLQSLYGRKSQTPGVSASQPLTIKYICIPCHPYVPSAAWFPNNCWKRSDQIENDQVDRPIKTKGKG